MTIRVAVTAAALALSLVTIHAPLAQAKSCAAKCKTEIQACKASCAELKGKAKHTCIKDCKTPVISLCKERKNKTACSPSGAFLE
jgi:hypothetical protein